MNTQEFLQSLVVILSVMAAVALLEAAAPFFPRPPTLPGRQKANLGLTAVTLLFAFLLTSTVAVAAAYLPLVSPGLMDRAGLPMVAQILLGIVALDFAYGYAAHWTLHASPFLWRFHRVHHSDAFVDVTTSFRTHPVENAWRHLWLLVTVWMLDVPVASVAAFRVLSAVNGIFEHANIRVAAGLDAALSWAWVTPHVHKVHHSREQAETDSNYGNLFTFHDRLFGTFVSTTRAASVRYGLDDAPPAETSSLGALLALPWRRAALPRAVAVEAAR
jgi:sterol desaturase/sphingolipid hydroxylase (fatty acid hydroxylase superfamily)